MDNQKDIQVLIVIRKDILNKIIIENYTNQVNHPYCIVLDIREFNPISEKYSRKIRIINLYNNKISNKCIWQGFNSIIQ